MRVVGGINLDQDISTLRPEQLGSRYKQLNKLRLEMQKAVEAVEQAEKAAKARIIETIAVGEGFFSDGHTFVVTSKDKPIISDWDKLADYVVDNDRFDFYQKRLSDKAVMDTENWTKIPGIGLFVHKDLSVTKK